MEKGEFDFVLTEPVDYHAGGESRQGKLLVLRAPSNKVRQQRTKLKQWFMQSLAELQTGNTTTDGAKDGGISEQEFAEYVVHLLYSSKTVSMVNILDEFKALVCSPGICKVENEVDMTSAIFDKLDSDDTDRMVGEYLANFILASFYRKHLTK